MSAQLGQLGPWSFILCGPMAFQSSPKPEHYSVGKFLPTRNATFQLTGQVGLDIPLVMTAYPQGRNAEKLYGAPYYVTLAAVQQAAAMTPNVMIQQAAMLSSLSPSRSSVNLSRFSLPREDVMTFLKFAHRAQSPKIAYSLAHKSLIERESNSSSSSSSCSSGSSTQATLIVDTTAFKTNQKSGPVGGSSKVTQRKSDIKSSYEVAEEKAGAFKLRELQDAIRQIPEAQLQVALQFETSDCNFTGIKHMAQLSQTLALMFMETKSGPAEFAAPFKKTAAGKLLLIDSWTSGFPSVKTIETKSLLTAQQCFTSKSSSSLLSSSSTDTSAALLAYLKKRDEYAQAAPSQATGLASFLLFHFFPLPNYLLVFAQLPSHHFSSGRCRLAELNHQMIHSSSPVSTWMPCCSAPYQSPPSIKCLKSTRREGLLSLIISTSSHAFLPSSKLF